MTEGKPIFDSIQAFIAPIEAALAARRERYLGLITPAWRAQVEAKQQAVLAVGSAGQLRDLIASAIVISDLPEARRLYELLSARFPGSPEVEQSKVYLTTLYCSQSDPAPMLTAHDAAETIRIFQSEPCQRTGLAAMRLPLAQGLLQSARNIAAADAEHDVRAAADQAQQRRERDAYWGSMLGVVTGVIASSVASSAASSGPVVTAAPIGPAPAPAVSAPSAFPGQSLPTTGGESVAHNPANEARSCIVAIDRRGFAANGVRSSMEAVFRNSCAYSVQITWCVEGWDCKPGYSNLATVLAKSDRPISYNSTGSDRINWAACRLGFTRIQGELSPRFQHACK